MNPISGDVAKKFCELCNWAYECWLTHKRLFDENDRTETTIGKARYFSERLSTITQEYVLLQICKLHDPAIQGSSFNITIDYIVRFGDWEADAERIQRIGFRLTTLFEKIKSARNKVLAHNDLKALMDSAALGDFPKGLDDEYFSALQELVNEVHGKWFDGPYPFNDLAGADVDEFLHTLERA
jgi:AbiU2